MWRLIHMGSEHNMIFFSTKKFAGKNQSKTKDYKNPVLPGQQNQR